jgi:N6-adenosine-specific RNA methylase IME4
MEGEAFDQFVADIAANGLRDPIMLYEGKILDGRNRERACKLAGVEPRYLHFEYVQPAGTDPLAWIISANLHRRHLSESQRAMVAAKLATLNHGQRQTGKFAAVPTQAEAAKLLNVSERTVRSAAEVRDHAVPELVQAVEQGAVAVSTAAEVVTLPAGRQREIVARGEAEILREAKIIRDRKTEERRAQRIEKIAEISRGNTELPTGQRYPVLLADPCWRYEFSMTSPRAIEAKYPTMPLEEICALPVRDLAASTAVLFLWAPGAILEEAFAVIRAWGFTYCTDAVWIKESIGQGWWFRQQHEHLLIATRGSMPPPPPQARVSSVIEAPRREHSRKPDEAYAMIERMYPDLPKIELFARHRRDGWDAWGNEVEQAHPAVSNAVVHETEGD